MGAASSKDRDADADEKTFYAERETPISFSPGLINHLSDIPSGGSNTAPSSQRQATLDSHIKSRIASELARLKSEEDQVIQQVEAALEKENLDKELSSEQEAGQSVSSVVLERDVEEITKRVERNRAKRTELEGGQVGESKSRLLVCLKENQNTSLNCWQEVKDFKETVAGIEKNFVKSIA